MEEIDQNKAAVRAFIAAINRQDWNKFDDLVTARVVRHGSIPAQTIRGREYLESFLRQEAETFPDAHESIRFLVAEEDKVAACLTFQGTQRGPLGSFPPSNKQLTADFLCIFRLEGGRIAEVWVAYDNLATLTSLGHHPSHSP